MATIQIVKPTDKAVFQDKAENNRRKDKLAKREAIAARNVMLRPATEEAS